MSFRPFIGSEILAITEAKPTGARDGAALASLVKIDFLQSGLAKTMPIILLDRRYKDSFHAIIRKGVSIYVRKSKTCRGY